MEDRFKPVSQSVVEGLLSKSRPERVVLTGFMGVGKTEVGKICAEALGYEFCDTDAMVEAMAGLSIPEIFEVHGEAEFRRLERCAITHAAARRCVVIATGGGAPLDPLNQMTLKSSGTVVLLTARPRTIAARIGDPGSRPLLANAADPLVRIRLLLRSRRAAYAAIADISVSVDGRKPDDIAHEVVKRVRAGATRARHILESSVRLDVDIVGNSYPIWLSSSLIGQGGGFIIADSAREARACIVTHPHLKKRYAEPLCFQMQQAGMPSTIVLLPRGESQKNLRTVGRLYSTFVARLDRNGIVVAVGGGVIGDIAGFAAASYLRGVRCVQVPTTLLAQVDSSVGGKTGVDLPEGKNLGGAFHQPTAVLIDPEALMTLPLHELRSGLAEVIKYGIISDKRFFYQTRDELPALLKRDLEALKRAILRSCEIKAAVVAADEKEQGRRAILNFGHTVGHALESVTQYKRYRHGEAIAIGMVTACLIGEELNITPPAVTQEVSACLEACGLPVAFPTHIDTEEIHAAMIRDKKTQAGRLRFVLAERIGKVRIVDGVLPDVVDRAIARQKPQ